MRDDNLSEYMISAIRSNAKLCNNCALCCEKWEKITKFTRLDGKTDKNVSRICNIKSK